jgi:hypothetical protein
MPGCFGYTFHGLDKDYQGKKTVYMVSDALGVDGTLGGATTDYDSPSHGR